MPWFAAHRPKAVALYQHSTLDAVLEFVFRKRSMGYAIVRVVPLAGHGMFSEVRSQGSEVRGQVGNLPPRGIYGVEKSLISIERNSMTDGGKAPFRTMRPLVSCFFGFTKFCVSLSFTLII